MGKSLRAGGEELESMELQERSFLPGWTSFDLQHHVTSVLIIKQKHEC